MACFSGIKILRWLVVLLLLSLPGFMGDGVAMGQQETSGGVTGVVKDLAGALVQRSTVVLEDANGKQRSVSTDAAGRFRFTAVPAGDYRVVVAAAGLGTADRPITLKGSETLELADTVLQIQTALSSVEVSATREEIGDAQVQAETKQRVLGLFPNYYVVYPEHPVAMKQKQKFEIAAKIEFDPVTLGFAFLTAGIEQASNGFSGYGPGLTGYFSRVGASLLDGVDYTFLGGAVLPALLHQDPRYWWKGKGSVSSRALYAVSFVVRCKGDNGKWQPNYSNILGNLAAASISNAYYPASDRHGARLTIENSLIGTGLGAVGNLIEEFLIKHITPNLPDYSGGSTPAKP